MSDAKAPVVSSRVLLTQTNNYHHWCKTAVTESMGPV